MKEWLKAHLTKWGMVELKYVALVMATWATAGTGFFNGETFAWQDWAIFGCKLLGGWAGVTVAFVDQSYGRCKDG